MDWIKILKTLPECFTSIVWCVTDKRVALLHTELTKAEEFRRNLVNFKIDSLIKKG